MTFGPGKHGMAAPLLPSILNGVLQGEHHAALAGEHHASLAATLLHFAGPSAPGFATDIRSSMHPKPGINVELLQLVARHAPLELQMLQARTDPPAAPSREPSKYSLRGASQGGAASQAGTAAAPSIPASRRTTVAGSHAQPGHANPSPGALAAPMHANHMPQSTHSTHRETAYSIDTGLQGTAARAVRQNVKRDPKVCLQRCIYSSSACMDVTVRLTETLYVVLWRAAATQPHRRGAGEAAAEGAGGS